MSDIDVDWTVLAAPVPMSTVDPAAWAVHGAVAVSQAVELDHWGHTDLAVTAPEMVARLRTQDYVARVRLVAVNALPDDGRDPEPQDVVGTADVVLPVKGNGHVMFVETLVHPAHRRRGVGSALVRAAERIAAERGRTTVIASSEHPGEASPDDRTALEPPTGSGRIAAHDPGARFALRHGFVLEQAERYSVLQLPLTEGLVDRLHADATARAGTDYRLLSWADRTPEAWLEQYAGLYTRMSTDIPVGDLDIEEDPWDGERVRTSERMKVEAGNGYLTVVAEHVPTGRLAAFTMVEYPLDQPGVVFQEDTLVLKEHRGRRLGMLVKAELLRRLAEVRPLAARVHTWNAQENEHMLAINVALGFRQAGVVGGWQKKLTG